ncbi:MAG TPA: ABC-2 family transporter protein [Candidatus Saccharibacteria bacterium]|jgi:ABC-2 type transport system permease protein|nr:ABC-2 family transporter protein [Candidatus Saccharibacteria bacterium]
MSLRGAFAVQIFGMVLNNTALIAAWLFLFHKFGTINGWHAHELIGVIGINMLIFGVMMVFSSGLMDLPRYVDRGSLDSMLTKPAPLLLQLAGSNLDPTTFGDVLLGLGITLWYMSSAHVTFVKLTLFLLTLIVALVLFWCFALLLPNSLAFYIFDSERIGRYAGGLFLESGMYPTGVLTGALRMFLLTFVPGLFIGAVPLEVLYRFGWKAALLGIGVATFWLIFCLRFFKRSVKRYESSNLVGAR